VTPSQYIKAVPEPKRSELAQLDALIRKTVPSFEPFMAGSMIGYGKYHYRYASGREGDSCRVGLSGNKTGISVYVSCMVDGEWLAEQAKDRLGRATVGKSCIRFKRLADIDLGVLTQVLRDSEKAGAPGQVTMDSNHRVSSKKKVPKKKAAVPKKKAALSKKKAALPKKKAAS
jgi:hypothetical protein